MAKKRTTASKGSYYKSRTKKWFEAKGFQVAFLERMFMLYIKGKIIPIKKDQFASDLLAMSDKELIFVQVKFNIETASKHVAEARREFGKFKFPAFVKKWIVVWGLRKKDPQITEV